MPYIQQYGAPERLLAKTGVSTYASLAKSIAFQQLATPAAAAIFGRVLRVCKVRGWLWVGRGWLGRAGGFRRAGGWGEGVAAECRAG